MKKLAYYALTGFLVIVILPFLIVRGCGHTDIDNTNDNKDGLKINVYIAKENRVEEMYLEEYIKGVVAAEMPVTFDIEALKAQAVAARTYTLSKMEQYSKSREDAHKGADVCSDHAHCQAWISKTDAAKKWSFFSRSKNWSKINSAVESTEGIIITYNGKITTPFFHSNSGGKTENYEDVWEGSSIPYLKSVESPGEDVSPEFKATVSFESDEFKEKLIESYPEIELKKSRLTEDIKIMDYTKGGRVKTLQIGNVKLKGTDFRKIFSLRSANFTINEDKGKIYITTVGYGHGVGMSQWGANNMAKNGNSYEEIIKYYYTGVDLGPMTTPVVK